MPTIEQVLRAVQRRIQYAKMLRGAVWGALLGLPPALFVVYAQRSSGIAAVLLAAVIIASFALVSAFIAVARPVSLTECARRIDRYYKMKDRTLSALQFCSAGCEHSHQPVHRLMLQETPLQLRKVVPGECITTSVSWYSKWTLALGGILICLIPATDSWRQTVADGATVATTDDLAAQLRSRMLPTLAALADRDDNPAVRQLMAQFEETLTLLQGPNQELADRLESLSRLQQAIEQAGEKTLDRQHAETWQQLATAMDGIDALREPMNAIERQDYAEVAEALEQVDFDRLSQRQKNSLADRLDKRDSNATPDAKPTDPVGSDLPGQSAESSPSPRTPEDLQDRLNHATRDLADALRQNDSPTARSAARDMAEAARQLADDQQMQQLLMSQLENIARAKSQTRGQQPGDSDNLSDSPSDSWGDGTAGDPDQGPESRLAVDGQELQLESQVGDAPGQVTRMEDLPQSQRGERPLMSVAVEFEKQFEAALQDENLPRAHRRSLRNYFHQIRPQATGVRP